MKKSRFTEELMVTILHEAYGLISQHGAQLAAADRCGRTEVSKARQPERR